MADTPDLGRGASEALRTGTVPAASGQPTPMPGNAGTENEAGPVSPGDVDAAAERYRQSARNPLVPRHAVEELLAAMNRIIEVTEPDPRLPAVLNFSQSRQVALRAKRGIEKGLAERDAADRVEPHAASCPNDSIPHCKR